MQVRNYEVEQLIGESDAFRLYVGRYGEKEILLKVSKTFEDGDDLAEEARIIRHFQVFSDNLENLYAKDAKLHYDWLFLRIIDSWIETSQDDRRINVYEILDTKLDDLVPLSKLSKEVKVDVRTSIWILGRFFKLYEFFELYAEDGDLPFIDYVPVQFDRFLIGPEYHRLVLVNCEKGLRRSDALDTSKQIVEKIYDFTLPANNSNEEGYFDLLEDMRTHGRLSFERAHKELYNFINETFGRSYYPFTFKRKGNNMLETIGDGNPFK